MTKRFHVDWAGWLAAAATAPIITWLTYFTAAIASAGPDASGVELAPVVLVLALFLIFGLIFAVFAGTLGAGLMLWPFLRIAEALSTRRPRFRKRAIITCAALAGLLPVAIGLALAPHDTAATKLISYLSGTWLWAAVFRNQSGGPLTVILLVLSPVVGGAAAGLVYDAMTRPEPEGLTEPAPGAI